MEDFFGGLSLENLCVGAIRRRDGVAAVRVGDWTLSGTYHVDRHCWKGGIHRGCGLPLVMVRRQGSHNRCGSPNIAVNYQ